MASHLQQLLHSLCWNTEWNYAVFWKLKHRARMVLTWEDAYYNNQFKHEPSVGKSFGGELETVHDGHFAHDPLGLSVAKMSYIVYSLGEGIVGQVAVTGKHKWIFAGDHLMPSYPSPELSDGWHAQFSAGIKTIVVAAVVPHGVVQLGSLNKVSEDLELLTHIKEVFSTLQHTPTSHVQDPIHCHMQSALHMSDTSTRTLCPDVPQDYFIDLDKIINRGQIGVGCPTIPSPPKTGNDSFKNQLLSVHHSDMEELIRKSELLKASDNANIQHVPGREQQTDLLCDTTCKSNCYTIQNAADNFDPAACNKDRYYGEKLSKVESSNHLGRQKFETSEESEPKYNSLEDLCNLNSSFMFSAGSELHEALGPDFLKQCYPSSLEEKKTEDQSTSYAPEMMESSMLTSDSGPDHLLDAMVANFYDKDAVVKKTLLLSASESMLTTEKIPEPSIKASHTIVSPCYSISSSSLLEESTQSYLNSSGSCGIRSSTSASREPIIRSSEPGKLGKKRARPGENSRPRPRDRQLIQDRIKELRDLVPNGSKCSIDSLLERTIKHMVFLQSVTKHADKLSNCAKSKGCSNEAGVLGSNYEQGSSWAVEVGGHMKICPIVVENLNANGQMLIEMLCEDSDHFLEIAEVIRCLGLTILKGVTDKHGDKTWMRFVIEGQNNRNLHRMDVLWSLVQILQSKSTI